MTMTRENRKIRIRGKIKARSDRPQLKVFKSNQHLYSQIIEPGTGQVLAAASDFDLKQKPRATKKETVGLATARKIGQLIGEKAKKKKIKEIVFDRSPYHFHGQIKALAEGAREKGLKF